MKKNSIKVLKWSGVLMIAYLVLTTIILGYQDTDTKKGKHNFYWSGLNALWLKNKVFGFKINEQVEVAFNGVDGPYIVKDTLFFVTDKNEFKRAKKENNNIVVKTNCRELGKFNVNLKSSLKKEVDVYKMPNKLIAISDIEGNFNGFYSFLRSNKIIDKYANWIFGNGHLVLNGDFFDRGNQVTQVLWLIYHLESEAEKSGGKVHFILGNHEIMNMHGNVSYNDEKYIQVAKKISKKTSWDDALRFLYSNKTELGKWLRTKNIVEKIGDLIFVHGGLNKFHYEGNYSITELNNIAKNYYGIVTSLKNLKEERDKYVIGSINSPYWDRRLNLDFKHSTALLMNGSSVEKTSGDDLSNILKMYDASKIIIGHSLVDDVSSDYNNRVIKIDVKHGETFESGETKGVLVEYAAFYKINDLGEKNKLFNE
ncbi:metallophosphoesterase [Tenacibaculum halocynthiae]|uniref:metallophosphoesterase n=1 Tax=Tenacibaculum halocynthiae TaxID=1254437 RepID=UPI003D65A6E9